MPTDCSGNTVKQKSHTGSDRHSQHSQTFSTTQHLSFRKLYSIQKLNFVLKIRFNNDTLTPGREKQDTPCNPVPEFTVRPGYSLCSHTETVRELMFKKYFKILLVSKSESI